MAPRYGRKVGVHAGAGLGGMMEPRLALAARTVFPHLTPTVVAPAPSATIPSRNPWCLVPMNSSQTRFAHRWFAFGIGWLTALSSLFAQTTGTVQGRVYNPVTKQYLA